LPRRPSAPAHRAISQPHRRPRRRSRGRHRERLARPPR
jgi:hypothetical protein